jgi:ribosomal protein S18 acetylase RimI-like enzyme
LTKFFENITARGADRYFHPHPLTADEAVRRCQHVGKDVYAALLSDNEILAYGMLRGWDEGYEIPSLGIAVDPAHQGRGYGRMLMQYLHEVARARGAVKVRLRVHPENERAISLYRSLGYVFSDQQRGETVAFLDLSASRT